MSQTQTPTAPAPTRRRRYSRGQRWVLRLLTLAIIATAGFLVLALLTDTRMRDAGNLSSLAPGNGIYLIVGSDSRENLPPELGDVFGDFSGARADVIILAQVGDGRRQLLSLPRDLRVEVPGNGVNRINAAYAIGGPELMVETVALATGIRPNHYLEIEFGGFAAIVDALGGIELHFPYAARDAKSGLGVEAGTHNVNGATALAYARSRSYEEFVDGEWVGQGGGDITRTSRQREVLLAIMQKASSPSGLLRTPLLLNAVGSHLAVDSSVNVFTLLRTGLQMRMAGVTDSVSLPVHGAEEGGVSYVVRTEPDATVVLDAFTSRQPLTSE